MLTQKNTLPYLFLIGLSIASLKSAAQNQILHANPPLPSFEVATIKPWHRAPAPPPMPSDGTAPPKVMMVDPNSGTTPRPTPQKHMILPIEILITDAFNLPPGSGKRIVGGPDWIRQNIDQYEIQAKIEDSLFVAMQTMTPAQQREQLALMEQSLLADRFKLKVHFETREMPVYALIIAKGGPKLTPAKADEPSKLSTINNGQGNEMVATAVTLDQFVHSPLLGPATHGQPVVNQTGLEGAYDFTLKSSPEQSSALDSGAESDPPMFTAIQQQLGLKLVPSKAPVEVIVIDHIEQPSAN